MPTPWKVHRDGEMVGSLAHAEDAAALVSLAGGTVKCEGRVVWREGAEAFSAGESYDAAASVMAERVQANRLAAYDRVHGTGAAARLLAAHGAGA